MTDKSDNTDQHNLRFGIPPVKWLLTNIQHQDARLGLVISVFLLLLLSFTWITGSYGTISKMSFSELTYSLIIFLILAAGIVIFFKVLDGSILPRIILWYVTTLLLITVSLFWMQALLRTPAVFVVEAKCFVEPWSQGCPLGKSIPTTIVEAPRKEVQNSNTQNLPFPDSRNTVSVQFAGTLTRQAVIDVSTTLENRHWNIQGAARGGERTAQAVGINQVRYFHKEDAELAKQLATEYNATAKWPGFIKLSVAFVDGYTARVSPGVLEVWTSVD